MQDKTDGHGWTTLDGVMEPLWPEGDILPLQLEYVLEEIEDEQNSDDDEEE